MNARTLLGNERIEIYTKTTSKYRRGLFCYDLSNLKKKILYAMEVNLNKMFFFSQILVNAFVRGVIKKRSLSDMIR